MPIAQPAITVRLLSPVARAVALALPPRCNGCGLIVDRDDSLCITCWSGLTFIREPRCTGCGVPFEMPMGEDALCAPCMERRPAFGAARAAVVYEDLPRRIMMRFKYGGRPHLARMMAQHIRLVAADWLDDPEALIVPVPLARWRLWRRGYNQAGQIAKRLEKTGRAVALLDGLIRRRETRSSGGLSRRQRFANVRGVFLVHEKMSARVKGRAVLLVDDVMTTGATAEACAAALIRSGAASVRVLTWARALPSRLIGS